jgi:hypothetical protein
MAGSPLLLAKLEALGRYAPKLELGSEKGWSLGARRAGAWERESKLAIRTQLLKIW